MFWGWFIANTWSLSTPQNWFSVPISKVMQLTVEDDVLTPEDQREVETGGIDQSEAATRSNFHPYYSVTLPWLCLWFCICVSVFISVLVYVCLRCVLVAPTNERLLRTWPPFNHPASTNPVTLLWFWIKREKYWQRNRTSASVYWSVHLQQLLRIRHSQNIWVCAIYTRIRDSHYDNNDLEHKS